MNRLKYYRSQNMNERTTVSREKLRICQGLCANLITRVSKSVIGEWSYYKEVEFSDRLTLLRKISLDEH